MWDKENSLTFQNITQTMKINRSRKSGACCYHQDKQGKYRNRDNSLLYCVSCAIQEASRGAVVEDLAKGHPRHAQSSKMAVLQEVYEESQHRIHQLISEYNIKHQRLIEAMTDLQISDLITFNRKIEENNNLFKRMKEELNPNWDRQSLTKLFDYSSDAVFDHLQQLYQQVTDLATRIQHKPTKSKVVSHMSHSNASSPKPISRNRSQVIEPEQLPLHTSNNSLQADKYRSKQASRQSFAKSQTNTGSYHSKNSTVEQIKNSGLQDTPESVKMMVNESGLRTTNAMATTMFEKIDICESINVGQGEGRGSQNSFRGSVLRKNRYEDNQE